MTTENRELASEYFGVLNGAEKTTLQILDVVLAVDAAMGAMLEVFEARGVKFPNDDRCANVEVILFKYAKQMLEES